MPNLLLLLVFTSIKWSAAPVLVCAAVGSTLGRAPFKAKQIAAALLGMTGGLVVVAPVALLSLILLPQQPPWIPSTMVGVLVSACVAYHVARLGRSS